MRGIVTGRAAVFAVSIAGLLLSGGVRADSHEPVPPPPVQERGIFTGEQVVHGVAVVFDAVLLRPISAATTLIGFGMFVPAALLSVADYPDSLQEAWDYFVMTPARNVYERPLGDL